MSEATVSLLAPTNGRVEVDEWTDEDDRLYAQRMLQYCKPVGLLDGRTMVEWEPSDWEAALGYVPLIVVQDHSELLDADVVVGYVEGLRVPKDWIIG